MTRVCHFIAHVLLSKPTARAHVAKRSAGAAPSAGLVRASLTPTALHRMSVSPVLHRPWRCAEPTLHHLRREDVVFASPECWPNTCKEVVQVRGDETSKLAECSVLTVDDEGHEQEGEGQEL